MGRKTKLAAKQPLTNGVGKAIPAEKTGNSVKQAPLPAASHHNGAVQGAASHHNGAVQGGSFEGRTATESAPQLSDDVHDGQKQPAPAGLNGAQTPATGVEVQVPEAAPQRERLPVAVPQQDANGTTKRGPRLSSIASIERELARVYGEQKLAGLSANEANARVNTLRSLAQVKQQQQALSLAAETAKLAEENAEAEAAESGDMLNG